MNHINKKGLGFSISIIALGVAWLLNVTEVLPGVDWVWTGLLGVVGLLVLGLGGINQLTVIIGPFLIVGSVLSVLRQTGRLRVDIEVPILVICLGVLILISYLARLPLPAYLQKETEKK